MVEVCANERSYAIGRPGVCARAPEATINANSLATAPRSWSVFTAVPRQAHALARMDSKFARKDLVAVRLYVQCHTTVIAPICNMVR